MLIDLMLYKPKFLVGQQTVAPAEIGMYEDGPPPEPASPPKALLQDMATAEKALRQQLHMPPKARFTSGPALHVQFDGGAQDGIGTGGFVILDGEGKELVRIGRHYGPGRTNNEAEAFAMRDAV